MSNLLLPNKSRIQADRYEYHQVTQDCLLNIWEGGVTKMINR